MQESLVDCSAGMDTASEGSRIILRAKPSVEVAAPPSETQAADPVEEPVPDWRSELAAKMQNYRTRRKPRAPKYPSLQVPQQLPLHLPIETGEIFDTFRPTSADASRSSNALEPRVESELEGLRFGPELVETVGARAPEPALVPVLPTNLIEFPRSMESEAWDGLAEPVIEQPRILDAPEVVPPAPALGGILLEEPQEANPNPVADLPMHPASISRRALAAIVDAIPVGCAFALWGWIASKITQEIPPQPQLLISAVVAAGILFFSYQYLLMVYGGTTLGLRACRLELVALDGTIPGRKQRRWRLLAALLSAASLMLGYAWVLLDENRLCWHDRITRTYLRVRVGRRL
jgi:uncharacterized RDD family membrane protein YckC